MLFVEKFTNYVLLPFPIWKQVISYRTTLFIFQDRIINQLSKSAIHICPSIHPKFNSLSNSHCPKHPQDNNVLNLRLHSSKEGTLSHHKNYSATFHLYLYLRNLTHIAILFERIRHQFKQQHIIHIIHFSQAKAPLSLG